LNITEKIITTVINEQFTEALLATSIHNSVEISGFGKFVFNQTKAHKQMTKYQEQLVAYQLILDNPSSTPEVIRNTNLRMITTKNNIEHLKPKLHEPKTNI